MKMIDPPPTRRGIFAIGRTLVDEARTLVRQEIQLAKQEMTAKVMRDLKAAALLLISGITIMLAFFVFVYMIISDAFWYITGQFWAGLLITLGIYVVVFGILALIGFRRFIVPKPEMTIETMKENAEWAKQQLRRVGR